jgi:GT2 family glycosyltransferase
MPTVSIICPIFNGIDFLPTFFHSLIDALPEGAQLILIDDGSTQPVFDTVPEITKSSEIVRIRNDRNLGYSVAVNRGFRAASGDIIVQLNSDLILQSNTITAMMDLIQNEPKIGIVGSKLIFPTTHLIQHIGMAFGQYTRPHVYYELPSDHPLCSRTRECQISTGATAAMTRPVLDQLGPLDEQYFNNSEDIDHCLRARALGLKNFVCAESTAYHWQSQSGPARFARVETSDALFWSRWGGSFERDLGRFIDEALEHVIGSNPSLDVAAFEIVNLSRGVDESIVLERLTKRWPHLQNRIRNLRQLNNPSDRLWLQMLLPHWVVDEPKPFIYIVDEYRELEDNVLWFRNRRRVVEEELIIDLTAVVLRTSEIFPE